MIIIHIDLCFVLKASEKLKLTSHKKISQRPKCRHKRQHRAALRFGLKFGKVRPDDRSATSKPRMLLNFLTFSLLRERERESTYKVHIQGIPGD